MLKKIYLSTLMFTIGGAFGCVDELVQVDAEPPAVPRGVSSVTGDEKVTVSWYPNHESDFAQYNVYRSENETTGYFVLASTDQPVFVDLDVVNGQTYYYAVSAVDISGNESELSYDLVFDTPRPEGYNVRLYDFNRFPNIAGYDFSEIAVQDYRDTATDIYFEFNTANGGLYINTFSDDTDIQDLGYTDSMDDVSYAPEAGWSELGYVEAIPGHTYVVWTHDNHFAKIRVKAASADLVEFDWAYQIDPGNPELQAALKSEGK